MGYLKNATKAEQTLRKPIGDPAARLSRLRFCFAPFYYAPQNFDSVNSPLCGEFPPLRMTLGGSVFQKYFFYKTYLLASDKNFPTPI